MVEGKQGRHANRTRTRNGDSGGTNHELHPRQVLGRGVLGSGKDDVLTSRSLFLHSCAVRRGLPARPSGQGINSHSNQKHILMHSSSSHILVHLDEHMWRDVHTCVFKAFSTLHLHAQCWP